MRKTKEQDGGAPQDDSWNGFIPKDAGIYSDVDQTILVNEYDASGTETEKLTQPNNYLLSKFANRTYNVITRYHPGAVAGRDTQTRFKKQAQENDIPYNEPAMGRNTLFTYGEDTYKARAGDVMICEDGDTAKFPNCEQPGDLYKKYFKPHLEQFDQGTFDKYNETYRANVDEFNKIANNTENEESFTKGRALLNHLKHNPPPDGFTVYFFDDNAEELNDVYETCKAQGIDVRCFKVDPKNPSNITKYRHSAAEKKYDAALQQYYEDNPESENHDAARRHAECIVYPAKRVQAEAETALQKSQNPEKNGRDEPQDDKQDQNTEARSALKRAMKESSETIKAKKEAVKNVAQATVAVTTKKKNLTDKESQEVKAKKDTGITSTKKNKDTQQHSEAVKVNQAQKTKSKMSAQDHLNDIATKTGNFTDEDIRLRALVEASGNTEALNIFDEVHQYEQTLHARTAHKDHTDVKIAGARLIKRVCAGEAAPVVLQAEKPLKVGTKPGTNPTNIGDVLDSINQRGNLRGAIIRGANSGSDIKSLKDRNIMSNKVSTALSSQQQTLNNRLEEDVTNTTENLRTSTQAHATALAAHQTAAQASAATRAELEECQKTLKASEAQLQAASAMVESATANLKEATANLKNSTPTPGATSTGDTASPTTLEDYIASQGDFKAAAAQAAASSAKNLIDSGQQPNDTSKQQIQQLIDQDPTFRDAFIHDACAILDDEKQAELHDDNPVQFAKNLLDNATKQAAASADATTTSAVDTSRTRAVSTDNRTSRQQSRQDGEGTSPQVQVN